MKAVYLVDADAVIAPENEMLRGVLSAIASDPKEIVYVSERDQVHWDIVSGMLDLVDAPDGALYLLGQATARYEVAATLRSAAGSRALGSLAAELGGDINTPSILVRERS